MENSGSPKGQGTAPRLKSGERSSRAVSSTFERPGLAAEVERLRAEAERFAALAASKDCMIAELAHELRSPLNTILGWTELLLENASLDPAVAKGLQVIQRNAGQQARLVEDLLESARLAHKKVELRLAPAKLQHVLQAALDDAGHDARVKRVRIAVEDSSDVQCLVVDGQRLQQAISNLLSNAIKFSPEGEVVQVFVRSSQSSVEIAVQDSGPGVDPASLPQLFKRFAQGSSGASAKQGLGVGLAIAKGIVELHGGELRLEPASPGARFVISLPKNQAS